MSSEETHMEEATECAGRYGAGRGVARVFEMLCRSSWDFNTNGSCLPATSSKPKLKKGIADNLGIVIALIKICIYANSRVAKHGRLRWIIMEEEEDLARSNIK